MDINLSKLQEIVEDRETLQPWGRKENDLGTEQKQRIL